MSNLPLTIGAITDRGLNPRRAANEDRLLSLPEKSLFIVCDGVGGHRGGQVASQTAIDVFLAAYERPPDGDILTPIKQLLREANRNIYNAARELPELEGMASTITVLGLDGMRAVLAHVGDSRIYRFNGSQLSLETEDHSEVNDALRAGKISAAEALHHPHRNIISRALGADAEVEADFKMITIDERTSFLLCSDGITRHIPDQELEALMKSGAHPQNICEQMKELCFARGAEDNLTALIVDCGSRAYVEEATRPVLLKSSSKPVATSSGSLSRISVDFSANEPQPPAHATPQVIHQNGKAKSYFWGAIQLLILGLFCVGIFWIGKHWDAVKGLITGQPVPAPNASPAQPSPTPLNPDYAAAKALFEERRFDKARDSFTALAQTTPTNAEYQYWLGRSLLELKQYPEAIKHLNEAVTLDRSIPGIFVQLALAYEGAGDKKNASEALKKAAATPENSPQPTASATPEG